MAREKTPFFWTLFSAGGTVAALFFPVHLLLFGWAFPLGWAAPPRYETLRALVGHPLVRVYLFVFVSFPLFHWAHRFRYTLYDGLQLKHLNLPVAALCYGGAVAGTIAAAVLLAGFP